MHLLVLMSYMKLLVVLILLMHLANTCGSNVAGVIFQDRDTPANLEQVIKKIKFNQSEYLL